MITIYYILIKKSIKKLQNMNYNIKKDYSISTFVKMILYLYMQDIKKCPSGADRKN